MTPMRRLPERAWRADLARTHRRALEDAIERAIVLLDELDGDPDREIDDCDELTRQLELRGGGRVAA